MRIPSSIVYSYIHSDPVNANDLSNELALKANQPES